MPEVPQDVFRPRRLAVLCAAGATLLGFIYLASAGAPMRHLTINAAAFLIGFAALAVMDRLQNSVGAWRQLVLVAGALALLATALLGQQVEGAARWVRVGSLSVQPSMILLPLMSLAFAQTRSWLSTLSVMVAAIALAIQPDRGMAGVLAASLGAVAVLRPGWMTYTAAGGGLAAFAATMIRADQLPAVPYVDGVLYSAFDVHVLTGAAVLAGCALLIVPAIVGWTRDATGRTTYAALGGAWSAAVIAAALGNYPMPLVSYGGSAIIGYLLCLAAMPKLAAANSHTLPEATANEQPPAGNPSLRATQLSA